LCSWKLSNRNRGICSSLDGLSPTEKKIYELLSAEESRPIDNFVETSGLNSNEVLATLFTLELKGIVRQLPRKQFNRVLL
jgi:predicted Rossmann fold nucleotide-binding protein DprA/Smf involved in DNA uptake